ncbi:hypothetical protein EMIT0P294_10740 [Pseudomonas sp. IT-P294]
MPLEEYRGGRSEIRLNFAWVRFF